MVHVVTELVREHRPDLVGGEARDQRVEEDDPTGPADSGQRRIRSTALA